MHDSPRVGRWVLALIALLAVCDAIGAALSPHLLVNEPLALLALNADDRHVVLLAGRVPLAWTLAIAIPRRLLSALAAYGFGAHHGRAALVWAERRSTRAAKIARAIERLFARVGAPLLIVLPGYTLGVIAGASGTMRLRTFVPCVALGQLALISAGYFFGAAIRAWTDAVVSFLSRHVVESTAIAVAVVVALQVVMAVRRRRVERAARSDSNSTNGPTSDVAPSG